MEPLTLIIGNKNYSSWSLRPWLLLKYFEISFNEILIPLYEADSKKRILEYSSAGKVPALKHGSLIIGESLAIMEYLSEIFSEKKMWPVKLEDRARARAISHEMHSGFFELRKNMPMNIRGRHPGGARTPQVEGDIQRIDQIWSSCRQEFYSRGRFLFGDFTIADAMFAPVVTRFATYDVKLSKVSQEYAETVRQLPAMQLWSESAAIEPYRISAFEIYSQ